MSPFFLIGRKEMSVAELMEFNDLLCSIVRGNAAVDQGLQLACEGKSARSRNILKQLVADLQHGHSIADSLDRQPSVFPARYRTVVRGGESGGVLGETLESFSGYLRTVRELRRKLGLAMLYPIFVLVAAYVLFFTVGGMANRSFIDFYKMGLEDVPPAVAFVDSVYRLITPLVWLPPLILFVAWLLWIRSPSGDAFALTGSSRALRIIPGLAGMLKLYRIANFTHLIAELMRRNVAFTEAFQISAQACGDEDLQSLSRDPSRSAQINLPPFLDWLIGLGTGNANIGMPLAHVSAMYRQRADVRAEWLKLLAPFVFMVLIGGSATVFYVMTVFVPFTELMKQLG